MDDDDSTPLLPPVPPPLPAIAEACAGPITIPPGYPGPVSDAHIHASCVNPGDPHDVERWALDLLGEMNATGTQRVIVSGDPLVNGFSQSETIQRERELADLWIPVMQSCDRLRYQLSGFDQNDPDAVDYIEDRLDAAPFAGVGTIDMANVAGPISIAAPGLLPIYALLQERGLPFQFHLFDVDADFAGQLLEVVTEFPNVEFLHFGGDVVDPPPNVSEALLAALWSIELVADGGWNGRPMVLGSDVSPAGQPCAPPPPGHYQSFEAAITDIRLKLAEMPGDSAEELATGRLDRIFGPFEGPWPPE